MKVFHVYHDKYIKGLEKNGFINKDTGFKIQHCYAMPEHEKFNHVASVGSKLYSYIAENKFPFYVDRLAGGLPFHRYPIDFNLLEEYNKLLGNWFLGFQLHEVGSNLRHDWNRIINGMGSKGSFTAEELRNNFTSHTSLLSPGTFSMGDAEEYANRVYSDNVQTFIKELRELFIRRSADANGYILPCDSYYLLTRLQNELGMKSFMPEVGHQIPLMRVAVALSRGIAESNNKTWGVYYETWRYTRGAGITGMTAPCYNNGVTKDMKNEWYLTKDLHGDDMESYGENGGSSRLLQRRIYFYSVMCGAQYIAEEWGLNNCFYDTEDFALSPYGQTKKEFIEYVEKIGQVKSLRPFAIVLPISYSCVELPNIEASTAIGEYDDEYMACVLNRAEVIYTGKIEDVIRLIFARHDAIYGNEGHVMTNSRFGDMFDIIYADATVDTLDKYECLIDADPNGSFVKSSAARGRKVLKSDDLGRLEADIRSLIPKLMPCTVDNLHWLVSFGENGKRYLSIFNNEGNERTLFKGDTIISAADRVVNICFEEEVNLNLYKASCEDVAPERIDSKSYRVNVPAAGFVIFEF